MNILIQNCNCIKTADINIVENALNIKYGLNGTGKSTICKAIFAKSQDNTQLLNELCTYGVNKDSEHDGPQIDGLSFNKVMVFDESYINSYLFEEKSFLNNSFNVFLRSAECDKLVEDINQMLSEIQGIFDGQEEIHKLQQFLPQYFNIVKCTDGQVQKKGGVGEFIKGNGSGFQHHPELDDYKSYYEREMAQVSKWAKWRNDGIKQMEGDKCPFCTHHLDDKINQQNTIISKVFKNSALSTANAVLDYLDNAIEEGFINADTAQRLKDYVGDCSKSDDLYAELQCLATETNYLNEKITKICSFRPMNVTREQLQELEKNLNEMIINERYLINFYNTELIKKLIDIVRDKITNLKRNTGKLKGLFFQHDKKINDLINNKKEDINNFFALAGFPYKFEIESQGEKQVISYLVPNGMEKEEKVENPSQHLSWGERNAFSLVMFMFEAISRQADLIVLDDPITSFDKDKKFAIIRRLFDNKLESFKGKTVLMVTHELQPIIDYVYENFFSKYGLPVKAMFLQNVEGKLKEYPIQKNDLCNAVILAEKIAKDETRNLAVRIVNLRKYIELTHSNYSDLPIYEILSNLVHGRSVPKDKNGNELDQNLTSMGCVELKKYLKEKEYDEIIVELNDEKLMDIINHSEDTYSRIIASRLYFERHDGMLNDLGRKFPAACKFVNETNHIENDYIFQLNPFKFFEIPVLYLNQVREFLNKHIH